MNFSSVDDIKTALSMRLLTTKGAIYFCLKMEGGGRPCQISEWLDIPVSTVYAGLRAIEVTKKKTEGYISFVEGVIIRESPGAVYQVK